MSSSEILRKAGVSISSQVNLIIACTKCNIVINSTTQVKKDSLKSYLVFWAGVIHVLSKRGNRESYI